MDMSNIKQIVASLSKLVDENEKIALPIFSIKLAKACQSFPEDQTIGMMSSIVSKMAHSNKLFITRSELKDLYKRLYSRNTKFAELFKDEIGEVEKLATPKLYDRSGEDKDGTIFKEASDKSTDQALLNALNSAFGNKDAKTYLDSMAKTAKRVCELECASVRVASKVEVVNGSDTCIICRASFETPKGLTSVFIPVEISAGKALLPSVFVGNSGPEDFTKENLQSYIVSNAGVKLSVNEEVLLKAASANQSEETISSVDLALIKLNAEKETKNDFLSPQIVGQDVAEEGKDLEVKLASYKDEEVDSFAKNLDSAQGIAKFKFGEKTVNHGKKVLANHLATFGLNNVQITVCDVDNSSVVYGVYANAGRTAFRVPMKVNDPFFPNILICNGSVRDFSKKSVLDVFEDEATDYKTAAVASPLYGLKASELVQIVRNAVSEENYAKAEDALNILSESGDDKAYKTAFTAYSEGLSGKKENTSESKCSMVVKNAHSKHPICGHTNLPLHKVYQDKNGDCHPLYRKGMEDTREGAYFMNSKIFF